MSTSSGENWAKPSDMKNHGVPGCSVHTGIEHPPAATMSASLIADVAGSGWDAGVRWRQQEELVGRDDQVDRPVGTRQPVGHESGPVAELGGGVDDAHRDVGHERVAARRHEHVDVTPHACDLDVTRPGATRRRGGTPVNALPCVSPWAEGGETTAHCADCATEFASSAGGDAALVGGAAQVASHGAEHRPAAHCGRHHRGQRGEFGTPRIRRSFEGVEPDLELRHVRQRPLRRARRSGE